jgi:hypothetical protein
MQIHWGPAIRTTYTEVDLLIRSFEVGISESHKGVPVIIMTRIPGPQCTLMYVPLTTYLISFFRRLADTGDHATSLDALWALRDFLTCDSLGITKLV